MKPTLVGGLLAKRITHMLIGIAKNDTKFMIEFQFPIPLEHRATLRLPYSDIMFSLITISSMLVRKENKGAKGKDTEKKAMKPS